MGSREKDLKRSFKLALNLLLTTFSKQDFCNAFPKLTQAEKERMHRLYIQVIVSVHQNIEDEFERLCEEAKLGSVLNTVEELVEEHALDPLYPDKSIEIEKRLKMDVSESEAIFDSLDLNPQLFINSSLNIVDQLVESAFDYLHQEASTQLKIDDSERSEDLTKGLDYIRNTIQSALDKRLSSWEKFCFLHIFALPEGFSLPKDDEASDSDMMDVEDVGNSDLDAQLASLKTKLLLAEQEPAELKTEIQALERQSVISNQEAALVNELTKLSEQLHENDAFEEMQKLATDLRTKMEKVKMERGRARLEKPGLHNGDLLREIRGNGLSNLKPEESENFLACLNTR